MKCSVWICVAVSLTAMLGAALGAPSVGRYGVLCDIHAYNRDGTVLVPLRGIAEWLGAAVEYSTPDITVRDGSRTILLTVGSRTARIGGTTATRLSAPPTVYGGIICVPLRFVAEGLGASVSYLPRGHEFEPLSHHPVVKVVRGPKAGHVLVHGEPPNVVMRIIADIQLVVDRQNDPYGSWGAYGQAHGWLLTVRDVQASRCRVWGPTFSRPQHDGYSPTECSDADLEYLDGRWRTPPGH